MSGFTQQMHSGESSDLCRGEGSCFSGTPLSVPQTNPTWPSQARWRPAGHSRGICFGIGCWHVHWHHGGVIAALLLTCFFLSWRGVWSGAVRTGSDDLEQTGCHCSAQRQGWMLPQSQAVYLISSLIGAAFRSIGPSWVTPVLPSPPFPISSSRHSDTRQ